MLIRLLLVSTCLAATITIPVFAQDNATPNEAKARELFAVMHMDALYGRLTQQMVQQSEQTVEQIFPAGTMNDAQKQEYKVYMGRLESVLMEQLSWNALEPDMARVYATNLSAADLDGAIAFYKSPAGQDLLAKQPAMTQQGSAIALARMQTIAPKLKQMMEDEVGLMKEKATPAPASQTSVPSTAPATAPKN